MSSFFSFQAHGSVPCLVPRPGGCLHGGSPGALGLLRAQLRRKMSGCAPATCSLPVFASAEEFLVPLGQVCAHTRAHTRTHACTHARIDAHMHTHISLTLRRATLSLSGRAGGAWALKLLFCNCREFGSQCQAFKCDSHQRKGGGGGGGGSVSEASTHRGCAW